VSPGACRQKKFHDESGGLFMNMDKMVGGEFEKGLATLKSVTEQPSTSRAEELRTP